MKDEERSLELCFFFHDIRQCERKRFGTAKKKKKRGWIPACQQNKAAVEKAEMSQSWAVRKRKLLHIWRKSGNDSVCKWMRWWNTTGPAGEQREHANTFIHNRENSSQLSGWGMCVGWEEHIKNMLKIIIVSRLKKRGGGGGCCLVEAPVIWKENEHGQKNSVETE